MYLKRDINGQASGFHYGNKNDFIVIVKRNEVGDMLLVKNGEIEFWILEDDLSENKIEDERQKIMERIQPVHKAKRRR